VRRQRGVQGRVAAVRALLACAALGAAATSPGLAEGREVALRADVSARQIGVEDQIQLTITLEGTSLDLKEELEPPSLTNLVVVAGPAVSTQISFVNGRMSQARTYTYLLQPQGLGSATVGPVRAVLADGTRTTDPITIEVHEGSLLPKRRPAPRSPFPFGDEQDPFEAFFGQREPPRHATVFVEAEVDRHRLFVGETLRLTYWVYTQTALAGLEFAEAPRYPGFWAEALPRETAPPQGEPVTRDGQAFTRFPVYRRLLFPTKAGTLTIPAATFTVTVPRRTGFFADPFPSAASTLTRTTRPVAVEVEQPPTAEPFSGAVGQFRASAAVDRETVELGEAVTYRFRVEGRGNLKWVDKAPPLAATGAKVYPPQVKDAFKVTLDGLEGSRTWEFVVVPQTAGQLTLPAGDFAYFDPAARRVLRATTPAITVDVRGATAVAAAAPAAPAATAAEGTTLRLRGDLGREVSALPTLDNGAVAVVLGVAALSHLALWGFPLLAGRRAGRARPAPRSARRALAEIRRAGRGGLTKEAAAMLIENALVEVFGEVPERPSPDDDERTATLRALLHEVRFVRYAPQLGDYSEKLRELADRASAAVARWA